VLIIDDMYATILRTAFGGSIAIVVGIMGSALTDYYSNQREDRKEGQKKRSRI
jgi:hypothetical protein